MLDQEHLGKEGLYLPAKKSPMQQRGINYASQSNRRPGTIIRFNLSILTLHAGSFPGLTEYSRL